MSASPLSRPVETAPALRGKRIAFAATLVVFAASWIHPVWPAEQALHSSLTVIALAWLVAHDRRWSMRTQDFIAVCGFIAAHAIASRWRVAA